MLGGGIIVAALLACLIRGFRTESDIIKYPIPIIVNEDPHVVVSKGGSAALYCKIACDCGKSITPRISWLENGRGIVANGTKYASSLGVLHVKNCSSYTQNRVFRCVVSVGNWSVVGVERKIHVVDASSPVLSLQKTNHALKVGDSAVLRCSSLDTQILKSSTNSNILWFKDGKPIQFANKRRNSSLPGGYLVIHPLVISDGGVYQCRYFVNALKHSVTSNSVYVSVGSSRSTPSAPEFSYVSKDTEVVQRSPVSIICAASGNPTPRVTISRENGLPSSVVVAVGYGVANITLPSVQLKDAGRYACNIMSGGTVLQRIVRLKVLSSPKFDKVPPKRILTLKGTELSITCLASGIPEPSITWYKNGKRVVESEMTKLNGFGLLTLKKPQTEDAGIYQCIAANKAGSLSHSTFVFLEKSLRPPINVKATALTASSLNVTWELNPVNNVNAMLAHVLSYECDSNASKRTKVIDDVSTTSRKIDELLGGTPYVVHVSTYGRNGVKSPNSKAVRVKTLESVPTISPHPVTAVNLGNRVIRVLWTPIPLEFAKGKIAQYKVEYGIAGFTMEALIVPAGKTYVDIKNLRLGELYTIEVSAGTRAGFGVAAQTTIKIGDPEIADQKGPAMELRQINSTAVEVDWSLSKPKYITGFVLTYVPIVVADYWHSVRIINLKPKQRSYILANLNPRKDYRIEIRIMSGPVRSKSSVIVHTANAMAPLPSDLGSLKISNPRNLECAVKDNTSIFLSWNAPIHTDDIDHYTVEIELGGKTIDKYRLYHTKELKYLLENLSRGTWYYVRVNAVPKPQRISEVSNRLKRKFKLPKFQSRMVACMTAERKPGPPVNVHCNVTKNGLKAKAIWYPPEYPYGLIVKYIVRYKHLVSSPRKTNWKIGTVTMEPNSKGYPLIYDLDADYYKKYRIEVSAVNGAGEGPAAVVKSCALRRMPTDPIGGDPHDGPSKGDEIKLGIIVGCSIASLCIFIFIVVFIWKNPFRLKSGGKQEDDSTNAKRKPLLNEEFLYLQRLAELQGNTGLTMADFNSRCSSSGRLNANSDATGVSQPLMPKYHTAVELTGSSSGQPVCTCTCLLHGRLRGQLLHPRERRDLTVEAAKEGGDAESADRPQNSPCSSHNSEDIDSAESADSRTQMLQKSSEIPAHNWKESSAKVLQQIKTETTFQV